MFIINRIIYGKYRIRNELPKRKKKIFVIRRWKAEINLDALLSNILFKSHFFAEK